MKDLRKEFEKETHKVDENQDLSVISKAAAFLRTVKEKEKTLAELFKAEEHIKKELKLILLRFWSSSSIKNVFSMYFFLS